MSVANLKNSIALGAIGLFWAYGLHAMFTSDEQGDEDPPTRDATPEGTVDGAGAELDRLSSILSIVDPATPREVYRAQLERTHEVFPTYTLTELSDMAAKSVELCAQHAHRTSSPYRGLSGTRERRLGDARIRPRLDPRRRGRNRLRLNCRSDSLRRTARGSRASSVATAGVHLREQGG